MKADIDYEGRLIVIPETEMESYALKRWREQHADAQRTRQTENYWPFECLWLRPYCRPQEEGAE